MFVEIVTYILIHVLFMFVEIVMYTGTCLFMFVEIVIYTGRCTLHVWGDCHIYIGACTFMFVEIVMYTGTCTFMFVEIVMSAGTCTFHVCGDCHVYWYMYFSCLWWWLRLLVHAPFMCEDVVTYYGCIVILSLLKNVLWLNIRIHNAMWCVSAESLECKSSSVLCYTHTKSTEIQFSAGVLHCLLKLSN